MCGEMKYKMDTMIKIMERIFGLMDSTMVSDKDTAWDFIFEYTEICKAYKKDSRSSRFTKEMELFLQLLDSLEEELFEFYVELDYDFDE